jgi:hypothetical protein
MIRNLLLPHLTHVYLYMQVFLGSLAAGVCVEVSGTEGQASCRAVTMQRVWESLGGAHMRRPVPVHAFLLSTPSSALHQSLPASNDALNKCLRASQQMHKYVAEPLGGRDDEQFALHIAEGKKQKIKMVLPLLCGGGSGSPDAPSHGTLSITTNCRACPENFDQAAWRDMDGSSARPSTTSEFDSMSLQGLCAPHRSIAGLVDRDTDRLEAGIPSSGIGMPSRMSLQDIRRSRNKHNGMSPDMSPYHDENKAKDNECLAPQTACTFSSPPQGQATWTSTEAANSALKRTAVASSSLSSQMALTRPVFPSEALPADPGRGVNKLPSTFLPLMSMQSPSPSISASPPARRESDSVSQQPSPGDQEGLCQDRGIPQHIQTHESQILGDDVGYQQTSQTSDKLNSAGKFQDTATDMPSNRRGVTSQVMLHSSLSADKLGPTEGDIPMSDARAPDNISSEESQGSGNACHYADRSDMQVHQHAPISECSRQGSVNDCCSCSRGPSDSNSVTKMVHTCHVNHAHDSYSPRSHQNQYSRNVLNLGTGTGTGSTPDLDDGKLVVQSVESSDLSNRSTCSDSASLCANSSVNLEARAEEDVFSESPCKGSNPLREKLAQASMQILVHILAHCPEPHILHLSLARLDQIVAQCICEGPCMCPARGELCSLGGVPAILAVSRRYADMEDLQAKALGVLASLALCTDVQRLIANEGGVEVALASMSMHPLSAQVQCRGCKVLCNLAFEDVLVQMRIAESGGVVAIVRAMETLLSCAQVQAEGSAALCNLGANCDDAMAIILATSGAVSAVIKAMAMHGSSRDVQFKVGSASLISSYLFYRILLTIHAFRARTHRQYMHLCVARYI